MASHNYLNDPKNPFFSLEDDVDDETFLRNAPIRTVPAGRYENLDNDIMQTRQQLLQRKKEIEERTVQSSERSVSLLRDSEQIGVATAEVIVIDTPISLSVFYRHLHFYSLINYYLNLYFQELIRQKEQLQRTEKRLDDINSTLRFSQKHIQGIKSVFGSLKNYLSGKSLDTPIPSTKLSESSSSGSMTSPALSNTLEQVQSDINNSYSSTMIRGSYDHTPEDVKPVGDRVTKVLEQNLSEMSGSLARLKHLAIGLSEEIDSQNDLIDNITDKTEKADITLQQQNKDMLHLLKK
ncbi:Synaptosomal-associated protein 29 [Cyphomyrmex costatus]|uniref:Synaptosomal-associated protein 29 n=1 Tax=Cyphomyrmex costatus TaxID=456900 RepID=A0A151IDJ6_9HYME|nr:Synaptosomal-associated protein 29 [Cyphomyrmex costatus]